MRGHITERRPGVWRIVVSDRFSPDGKRRQIVRTVKGTKGDANKALTKLLRELDEGKLADGRQPLERWLVDEWLPAAAAVSKRGRPLAITTRARYSDSIRQVSRIIGKVRLSDLRTGHVEELRDRLLAEGLAPSTVSSVMRVLAQALGRAEAQGLARNWASAQVVNRPAGPKPKFTKIDSSKAHTILTTVVGADPWDAAVHLALGLGLRREEVLALRWEDVGDTVNVHRALTYAAGECHFGSPKSDAGEREIMVPAFVGAALRRHRAAQAERLLPLGIRSDLVIDNGIGDPWMPPSFSTAWRRFAVVHGFDGITFHGLRHGAATLLLAAGVPDTVALEVMGHADRRILRHYQEVVDELKQDAAAKMESLLGGAGS
jgi:integrase